jgi:hypothetical protein
MKRRVNEQLNIKPKTKIGTDAIAFISNKIIMIHWLR